MNPRAVDPLLAAQSEGERLPRSSSGKVRPRGVDRKGKPRGTYLKRFSRWMPPDALISTQYGVVTCLRWCELEARRIGAAVDRRAEVRQEKGLVALFVN